MFAQWHGADQPLSSDDENGYVETDPSGQYGRFNEVLGKGATKVVYRAFDELNGREVAWNQVKLSNLLQSPEPVQRIHLEVRLLSALDHRSIIRFCASWIDIDKRTINFITELLCSGTLRDYRQKYRRVDIRVVKNWARQILHGIIYLHSQDPPVIHRDLKCNNIFVNGHLGQVKIGDFGLAAVPGKSQNAHSIVGTPEFMAPELYSGDYNQLVDIYSFGMCVLEMLTGEFPYSECSNAAHIYQKVTSGKLPDIFHQISDPEAKRFIGRCLQIASKRPTGKQLLADPFLSKDVSAPLKTKDARREDTLGSSIPTRCMGMTIDGKLNLEEVDTILLKVKIAYENGLVRTIDFPFDIVTDTPIDIANEMVKELVIGLEAGKIAELISKEITLLVPFWKDREPADEGHQQFKGQCSRVGAAVPDELKGQCSMLPPDCPPRTLACGKGKKKLLRWLQGLKRRLLKTVQGAR